MARQGSGYSSATASDNERIPHMIRRNPERYAQFADSGPGNPLGRGHFTSISTASGATPTPASAVGPNPGQLIGQSVPIGCIRMLIDHVIQLYEQVSVETSVTVL